MRATRGPELIAMAVKEDAINAIRRACRRDVVRSRKVGAVRNRNRAAEVNSPFARRAGVAIRPCLNPQGPNLSFVRNQIQAAGVQASSNRETSFLRKHAKSCFRLS